MRYATCHPDRPHKAYGLCRSCYRKAKYHENPEPIRIQVREYRERNKEAVNQRGRERYASILRGEYIQETFKITEKEYDTKLANTPACELCHKPFDFSRILGPYWPVLDHDHETGKIRGFIHNTCNHGIGKFKEDPVLCRMAADYLIRFGPSKLL